MARKSRKNILKTEPVKNTVKYYKTAAYVRLSRENDETMLRGSIFNQADYVTKFINDRDDMELYEVYIDDGCSGTNYDRPAFQRMLSDMKSGRVNALVIKDLSRLGRNFIATGEYLEMIFPSMGVRVISITDNYDSNDIRDGISYSIMNMINEFFKENMHCKEKFNE